MEKQPNRLIHQKSPYLLQHAWNPVNWYPWGEEAFSQSRKTERPIFLSSGYSTCHWCHVMEHESFENPETAAFLNRYFVPVKLDREEHPDVDHLYMLFIQATSGRGGWPMSVWLTPDLKPFFGGSYFPGTERWGIPSFRSVLEFLAQMWKDDRPGILASAGSIMNQLSDLTRPQTSPGVVTDIHANNCLAALERGFDPEWGGFGGVPKFPRPAALSFLFSHAAYTGNHKALDMALLTLRKMAYGGIHDQLGIEGLGGGGLARYSTDRFWHVPHFEKMLYDNAQLASSYLEAYQATREELFADTARDIFNYVLCDMTAPEGAFYSAEDADSPDPNNHGKKKEGLFYIWTEEEIGKLLEPEEAALFIPAFGIRREGNAPDDPHGEFTGKNILIRTASDEQLAGTFGIPDEKVRTLLETARKKLFEARTHRPRPGLDDKILTAWNGLMISALAKGSLILGDDKLLEAAERAAHFIIDTLYDPESGNLLRRYRDGEAAIDGKASDYAFLIQGLLDLYQASFEPEWLRTAIRLNETQMNRFSDHKEGLFYSTACDDNSLPLRMIEDNDSAEPSANSVSALNNLRLGAITGREEFRSVALRTIHHFSRTLDTNPSALPLLLVARQIAVTPPIQIIFAGERNDPVMAKLVATAVRRYRPELTVIYADETLEDLLPEAAEIGRTNHNVPAAYLCAGGCCQPAISDPESLDVMLGSPK